MEEFESLILDLLLSGDHPALEVLRLQRHRAEIQGREYSGVGCFTAFVVPDNAPRVDPASFDLGDVWFRLDGCVEEGGVLLYVRNGCMETLEVYLYVDEWPSEVTTLGFGYLKATPRDASPTPTSWQFDHSEDRDTRHLNHQISGRSGSTGTISQVHIPLRKSRIKRWPWRHKTPEPSNPAVRWLTAEASPFGIPVLDCRPVTCELVATTSDPSVAASFEALRHQNGEELSPETLQASVTAEAPLAYPFQGDRPTGPVFKAEAMEVKWDVYCLDDLLLFTRSWTGELVYGARLDWEDSSFRITNVLWTPRMGLDPSYAVRAVDFLVKSHVYDLGVPHPLEPLGESDAERLALESFSQFGQRAWFGTFDDTLRLQAAHNALWGRDD